MADLEKFPCGDNLAKLSNPENERGELIIPLPFEGGGELVLRWEKIPNFEVTDTSFLYEWGPRMKGDKKGCHYLGRFFFNGEEMEREAMTEETAEDYHECRFDVHGNDSWGSSVNFTGDHGFNCTQIFSFVPKAGQFKAVAPVDEIIKVQFGSKGSYRLHWESAGGARWNLKADDEKYVEAEEVSATYWVEYQFDFQEGICAARYSYLPTDLWDTGEDEG